MVSRDLTMDDLQDKLTIKGTLFDILAATAERAEQIYQIEEAKKQREITPPPPPRKRSRERTAPRISHGNGTRKGKKHRSTSSASKKQKSNLPKKKDNPPPPSPPPSLPAEVNNAMRRMSNNDEVAAELVIQKVLTASDVNPTQCRLTIPFNQIRREDFLNEEEKRYLRRHEEGRKNKKKFKRVKIFEPSLAVETVKLCRWDMEKSYNYVINGEWKAIVARNHLTEGTVIQLWCFRVDEDLCFALVRLNH